MVVFIHSILQKLRSALKNERGEANYFSTVVFIFIAVVLLAFIGMFSDGMCDEVIRLCYKAAAPLGNLHSAA